MRKILLIITILTSAILAYSQNHNFAYSTDAEGNGFIDLFINDYKIQSISKNGITFQYIDINSQSFIEEKGWAQIPSLSCNIQLLHQDCNIEIIESDFTEITLEHEYIPSRGVIYRNQNPDSIKYEIAQESRINDFYPRQIIKDADPFSFRTAHGKSIKIYPVQYLANERKVRIYTHIKIKIQESGQIIAKNDNRIEEVENIYKDLFINYQAPTRDALSFSEYGDILVITPPNFESAIQPYITWKREKGYKVYTRIASATSDLQNLIANAYYTNTNILYVQLVGDWENLHSNTLNSSTCEDCPTDPQIGCIVGSDDIPDVAIGRFSCSTAEELQVQINKTILYEKSPNTDSNWRETFIGIGSEEGTGDDNEYDYEHIGNIFSQRLSNIGYTSQHEFYGNDNSATTSNIVSSINEGASTIAYCGHGNGTNWITGNFGMSSITELNNGDKLPFIVSAACRNGAFNYENDCFAEKWLKKENGGAVVTLMSSINQPWNPPMRGQDYFYDILSGGHNYDNFENTTGINTSEIRTHWGAIVLNTFALMLAESSEESDVETVKSWITFGDASLQLRTLKPKEIASSNNTIIKNFAYTTRITHNSEPITNALVCISQNERYFRGYTNTNGEVSIEHDFENGNAKLTVTAFNATSIYDDILVIPNDEPYLCITEYSPQVIRFNQSSNISITLTNYGNVASADSTKITLSCNDEFLTIDSAVEYYDSISAMCGMSTRNGFMVTISENVPDSHIFNISARIEYGDVIKEENIEITAIGPSCEVPQNISTEIDGKSCTISWDSITTNSYTIFDNFDDTNIHPTFTINSNGNIPWSYYDADMNITGGISGYSFTNNRQPMAFIVINPHLVYTLNGSENLSSKIQAHSGRQFISSFYTSTNTNDWIISPELNYYGDFELSFFVRASHQNNYTETLEVRYSTGSDNVDDFKYLVDSCDIQGSSIPDEWFEKTYSIPDSAKYIALRNHSTYRYFLCIDDIKISGNKKHTLGKVNIYIDGELVAENISNNSYTIENMEYGEHEISLKAACDDESFSASANITIEITEQCDSPSQGEYYERDGENIITWHTSQSALSYNVYNNGEFIANTADTSYVDSHPYLSNLYSVSSICEVSESNQIYILTSGINKSNENNISIYPNPTDGIVNIESNRTIDNISIYAICGKTYSFNNSCNKNCQIDISEYEDGIYFIGIIFEDGSTETLKIIKG